MVVTSMYRSVWMDDPADRAGSQVIYPLKIFGTANSDRKRILKLDLNRQIDPLRDSVCRKTREYILLWCHLARGPEIRASETPKVAFLDCLSFVVTIKVSLRTSASDLGNLAEQAKMVRDTTSYGDRHATSGSKNSYNPRRARQIVRLRGRGGGVVQ